MDLVACDESKIVALGFPNRSAIWWVQVIEMLERNNYADMHRYLATDITAAFGPNLLQSIGNPKLDFKVQTSRYS